jgi:hypothetical protein
MILTSKAGIYMDAEVEEVHMPQRACRELARIVQEGW